MNKRIIVLLAGIITIGSVVTFQVISRQTTKQAPLPAMTPESQQLASKRLGEIDAVVQRAITEKKLPGAVVMVARNGKSIYKKSFGMRMLTPHKRMMTLGTVFDVAELTQPLITAIAIMQLAEKNRLKLSDRVAKYFPTFARNEKQDITIEHLLRHRSGMPEKTDLKHYKKGEKLLLEHLHSLSPIAPTNKKFLYSPINYILLGKVVEKISEQSLDKYAQKYIFKPLGLINSHFNPHPRLWPMIAPNQIVKNKKLLHGQAHDPYAYFMDGISGHAGLFSTVDDIAILCQLILNKGWYAKTRLLSELSITQMTSTAPNLPPMEQFGLGWDIHTKNSFPRGKFFSMRSFGHTGSTGVSIWIDPLDKLFVIFLSNQHHPNSGGNTRELCAEISTIVARAIIHTKKKSR